jgi:hypothetical protein
VLDAILSSVVIQHWQYYTESSKSSVIWLLERARTKIVGESIDNALLNISLTYTAVSGCVLYDWEHASTWVSLEDA